MTAAADLNRFRNDITGQFGPQPRAEAGLVADLWDPTDGSFAFPPAPRSAADVIAFWRQVDIPDDALESMVQSSEDHARTIHDTELNRILDADPALRARVETGAASASDRARWDAALAQAEQAADEVTPHVVHRSFAKPVVRLASMVYWARFYLTQAELDKVLDAQVRLPSSGGDTTGVITTPGTVWDLYEFGYFYEKAIERPTETTKAESLRDMANGIRYLRAAAAEKRTEEIDLAHAREASRQGRRRWG